MKGVSVCGHVSTRPLCVFVGGSKGDRREVVLHGSSKLIWFQLGLRSSSNRRLLISFFSSMSSLMIIIQACSHTGFMTCRILFRVWIHFLKLWNRPGKSDLHLETSVKASCSAEIILKKGNGLVCRPVWLTENTARLGWNDLECVWRRSRRHRCICLWVRLLSEALRLCPFSRVLLELGDLGCNVCPPVYCIESKSSYWF